MLERGPDLDRLRGSADRLVAGSGSAMLVSAAAGIGTSTLLAAFLTELPVPIQVLRGWCANLVTAHSGRTRSG